MPFPQEFIKSQREKLLQEKSRIEGELKFIAEPTANPEDFHSRFENLGDDVDANALEVTNYEQSLAVEQDLEAMLKKINQALKAIDAGTYGKCEQGDDIEPQRLKVLPWATTCIKHSK